PMRWVMHRRGPSRALVLSRIVKGTGVAGVLAIAFAGCGDDGGAGDRDSAETGGSGIVTFTSGEDETGGNDSTPFPDLDPGIETTGNPGDCPGGSGGQPGEEYKFSIIWIANTGEGTVSKIDTVSA